VEQLVDDLDLFDEMGHVLVAKALLLEVLFYGYLLAEPFAQEDLAVAAPADGLHYLELLFGDEEV